MSVERVVVKDNQGLVRESCDVVATYEHGSERFARVEGDTIDGCVKLPERPLTPSYEVLCTDCGHLETMPDGSTDRVGDKHHEVVHEGSAELLARIHRIKTGHQPTVETVP